MKRITILLLVLALPLLLSAGLDETFTLDPITISNPTLQLTFSEPVVITQGELYFNGGSPIMTFTGDDFSGTQTVFSLSLADLVQGSYTLSVEKEPIGNPDGRSTSHINFEVFLSTPGFDIAVTSPHPLKDESGAAVYGYSTQDTYDLVLSTSEAATCTYVYPTAPTNVLDFTTTGGTTHTIAGLTQTNGELRVTCIGATAQGQELITFGKRKEKPRLRASVKPAFVTQQAQANVLFTVESPGQKVYCEATTNDFSAGTFTAPFLQGAYDNTNYISYNYSVNQTIPMEEPGAVTTYHFTITCSNLAGLTNTTTANVSVDYFSTRNIVRVSPGSYSQTNTPTLTVKMSRAGHDVVSQECKYNATSATPDTPMIAGDESINFSADITSLEDGLHTYKIWCRDSFLEDVYGEVSFTVDTKPPHSDRTLITHDICTGEAFNGTIEVNSDDFDEDINFAGYNVSIWRINKQTGDYIYLVENEGITQRTFYRNLTSNDRFLENETYQWKVVPFDLAGWSAEHLMAATTHVWPPGSDECDSIPPVVKRIDKGSPARVSTQLNCTDEWSGCKRSFNYSKMETSKGQTYCTYNITAGINPAPGAPPGSGPLLIGLSDVIPFYTDQHLCWRVWDNNGNLNEQMVTVKLSDYLPTILTTTPTRYWASKSVLFDTGVGVEKSLIASDSCRVSPTTTFPQGGLAIPLSSSDGGYAWTGSISVTDDGDYIAKVNCTTREGEDLYKMTSFTVDSTPPSNYEVVALSEPTCSDQSLTIEARPKEHYSHDKNFLHYEYTLNYAIGTDVLASGNSTTNVINYEGNLDPEEQYKWHVTVVDKAGNTNALSALTMHVVPSGDATCDYVAPTGSVTSKRLYGGEWVRVACQDDRACTESFNWDFLLKGSTASCDFSKNPSLTYSVQNESQSLLFYDSGTFCYQVFDEGGNQYNGTYNFTVNTTATNCTTNCTTNTTQLHCTNNQLDLDEGETDVDCGGFCPACGEGSLCTFNGDCETGVCDVLSGACILDTCNNNVTDGLESDVDCGGRCSACAEGEGCASNEDCSSLFCNENKTCETVSCTDGIFNGYESDVDCGGAACPGCQEGEKCLGNSDCESGSCDDDALCASGDPLDSDGDGMPDDWENAYGLDPNNPNDAYDDPDEDGLTNYEEYMQNSDPLVVNEPQEAGAGGFSISGLILIILGIIVMGGSGYWLYYEHEEKGSSGGNFSQPAYQPRAQPLSPGQRTALSRGGAVPRTSIPSTSWSTPKKVAQPARKSIAGSFDEEKPTKTKPGDIPEKSPDDKPEKDEDKFISLADLGKKAEEKVEKAGENKEKNKEKKKDVFSDLDGIIEK